MALLVASLVAAAAASEPTTIQHDGPAGCTGLALPPFTARGNCSTTGLLRRAEWCMPVCAAGYVVAGVDAAVYTPFKCTAGGILINSNLACTHTPVEQIAGPRAGARASEVAAEWRKMIEQWRAYVLHNASYTGSVYDVPQLKWTQTDYISPQMHPFDRYFWSNGSYTVQRYLEDLSDRYGGIDSLLLWPTCELLLPPCYRNGSCCCV
jgi:hypothetical protein